MNKKIVIVYHSGYGQTRKVAEAVDEGNCGAQLAIDANAHHRDDLNHLGGYSGLLTVTPSDASTDEMVPGDLATARAFGQRLVEAAALLGR